MIEVKVIHKRREAEWVYSFVLAPVQDGTLPSFSAGAHIDVQTPNGLVRQYSLCNHPDENHRYEIAVLLDPSSRGGSQAMHLEVEEGDILKVSEPRNLFMLENTAKRSLLFAGGDRSHSNSLYG
ncbi:ferredoxin reductase [Marinobacterium lacunae]|uniref:ferredoxin reductase n=1 Tax=Marinobacterium lacunae TaxID=1232683 RepID=UPI001E299968|nr:ferredoxin reductase [Marinobacterium lacunae]